ncbi:DUF2188 domain-containing protein [Salinisphaera sp. C84B14]|uniref:DUF2188 domain-containing protein n=1 Tax=Salinisphaera sp. C84B14 TaxID=1304155 RepID=UPI0033427251
MALHVYRVVRYSAYWYVEQLGTPRPCRGYRCRDNAIARAMDLASRQRPSLVRVENAAGEVEIERNFGRPANYRSAG